MDDNPLCDQDDFHDSEGSDPEDQEMYGEKHYTNFLPSHPLDDNYDLIGDKDRAGSACVAPSDIHKVKMPTTVRRIRRTMWTKTGGRRWMTTGGELCDQEQNAEDMVVPPKNRVTPKLPSEVAQCL